MIIEWQTNVAGFAGNHTYFGLAFQSRISATSESVVVATGAGRRRYILPNNMRVDATEDELDRYLLPFTKIERAEIVAASTPLKPIKPSTVARQAAITPEPLFEELDYSQIAILLLL